MSHYSCVSVREKSLNACPAPKRSRNGFFAFRGWTLRRAGRSGINSEPSREAVLVGLEGATPHMPMAKIASVSSKGCRRSTVSALGDPEGVFLLFGERLEAVRNRLGFIAVQTQYT